MGWQAVRITADTNILVRVLTEDDAHQSAVAQAELETADLVAIPISALCEVAWVLSTSYRLPRPAIAEGIRRLVNGENAAADTNAVDAGLAHLDAGGDFADGVIAHEGWRFGATEFVSFDRKAVALLAKRGEGARLLR